MDGSSTTVRIKLDQTEEQIIAKAMQNIYSNLFSIVLAKTKLSNKVKELEQKLNELQKKIVNSENK